MKGEFFTRNSVRCIVPFCSFFFPLCRLLGKKFPISFDKNGFDILKSVAKFSKLILTQFLTKLFHYTCWIIFYELAQC